MKNKISSEPFLFVYAFNFATWLALIPQVILFKVCIQNFSTSSPICQNITKYPDDQLEIQQESTYWQMIFFLTVNILSLFSILILGPATDVIGRKKGFLFVGVLMVCMNGVLLLNICYEEISPGYMTFCAILSGMYGDLSGAILLSYSDVADVTDDNLKTRTLRMGVLESCLFLGIGIGGVLSGYLIEHFGFKAVPIANMVFASLLIFYIMLCLPQRRITKHDNHSEETVELLSDEENENKYLGTIAESDNKVNNATEEVTLSLFNPWFHLKHVLKVFFGTSSSQKTLIALFFAYFLAMFTITGDGYVLTLYLKNAPFNVSPSTLGILIMVHGFVGFTGAIIGGFTSYFLKVPDDAMLVIGLLGQVCTFVMLGAARSLTLVIVSRISGWTHPVVSSTFRSYSTKIAGVDNRNGSVLSALECLDVVASILSSFVVLIIYRATLPIYSGIIFFVLAGFSVLGCSLIAIVSIKTRRMTKL